MFLVKWKDFGDEHNSWEPESALTADGLYVNTKLTDYWHTLAQPISLPPAASRPATARSLTTKKIKMKVTKRRLPMHTRSKSKKA
jgi:hypothetical protein